VSDLPVDSAVALIESLRGRRRVGEEALRATLAGLSAVNVQVEPLNADAERDGLLRDDLQADAESALREAGIGVLSQAELFLDPAAPVLHIDVMTMRLDGRCAYSVRLELWQAVRLVRDSRIRVLAMTWSKPQIVGTVAAERLSELRSTVRAAVQAFAGDALTAVP
jgi:hypothetical protein